MANMVKDLMMQVTPHFIYLFIFRYLFILLKFTVFYYWKYVTCIAGEGKGKDWDGISRWSKRNLNFWFIYDFIHIFILSLFELNWRICSCSAPTTTVSYVFTVFHLLKKLTTHLVTIQFLFLLRAPASVSIISIFRK